MKKTFIACMVLMAVPCLALTPDDIDELIKQVVVDQPLIDDVTRAFDPKSPRDRLDHLAKRIENQVDAYCKAHNVVLHALPRELHDEVRRVTTLLVGKLTDAAKPKFVNDHAIKKLVHKTMPRLIDHKVCYMDKKDIPGHIEKKVSELQKKIGIESCDMPPMLQDALKQHKKKVHTAMAKRLANSNRSYTSDKEIDDMTEGVSQLLLKQMWASIQMKAQEITLAYLKKYHANNSLYIQPPEAKRLQIIADGIKKHITDF